MVVSMVVGGADSGARDFISRPRLHMITESLRVVLDSLALVLLRC